MDFKITDIVNLNYTIALIKPDAVENKIVHKVMEKIEGSGFDIAFMKTIKLTDDQAKEFYSEHSKKSFFDNLIWFMTSAPLIVLVLKRTDAVRCWRNEMDELRSKYKDLNNSSANVVHGSDSDEAAFRELNFLLKHKIIMEVIYG